MTVHVLPSDWEDCTRTGNEMYGIAVVLLDGHGAGDDGDDLAAGEELPPRLSRFALPDSGLNAAVGTGELDICTSDDVSAEWLCTGLAEQCLLEDPTCAVQLCGTEGNGHNSILTFETHVNHRTCR